MAQQQTSATDIVAALLEAATDRPFMPSAYKETLQAQALTLVEWCKDTEVKAVQNNKPATDTGKEWGD